MWSAVATLHLTRQNQALLSVDGWWCGGRDLIGALLSEGSSFSQSHPSKETILANTRATKGVYTVCHMWRGSQPDRL